MTPEADRASASHEQHGTDLRAPDFSLRQLSYFIAVAHHQSLQKASEALHVSAPAISAAVAHLEATLHTQLFVRRHARHLTLTEAGSDFAVECRSFLQAAAHLGAGRIESRAELQGRLHLGCLFSFAPYLIPRLLRDVQRKHAKIRLAWHEGHHEYLLEGLQTGAFDLAIMYDFEVPSSIATIPLKPAPLRVVVPGGHPLLRAGRATLAELATEPLILLDTPRTRDYLLSTFSAQGVAPRIAYRVQSMGMLQGLVQEGFGYSLLNFCPPFTHSFPLRYDQRAPNLVVAYMHQYRLGRTAAAVMESIQEVANHFNLGGD
jgi:DNA-binding transcriptional LysR family regulator